jgi:hypothetical protein
VETWTFVQAGSPAVKLPRPAPCQEIAGLLAWNGPDQIPLPPLNPRVQSLADHITIAQQPTGLRTKTVHVNGQAAKRGQAAKTRDVAGN